MTLVVQAKSIVALLNQALAAAEVQHEKAARAKHAAAAGFNLAAMPFVDADAEPSASTAADSAAVRAAPARVLLCPSLAYTSCVAVCGCVSVCVFVRRCLCVLDGSKNGCWSKALQNWPTLALVPASRAVPDVPVKRHATMHRWQLRRHNPRRSSLRGRCGTKRATAHPWAREAVPLQPPATACALWRRT